MTEKAYNTDEAEAVAMLSLASHKRCLDSLAPISTFDLRDTLQVRLNKHLKPQKIKATWNALLEYGFSQTQFIRSTRPNL